MTTRRDRRTAPRWVAVLRTIFLVALAGGVFALAVWLFRGDNDVDIVSEDVETSATTVDMDAAPLTDVEIVLAAVDGETGSASAVRHHDDAVYRLTIVADLPPIDGSVSYEAWFVKPGITDFFSLGTLFPREDGKWGLVWEQTTALVRNDIVEFNRIIVIREPQDGNSAPSSDHVLSGGFE